MESGEFIPPEIKKKLEEKERMSEEDKAVLARERQVRAQAPIKSLGSVSNFCSPVGEKEAEAALVEDRTEAGGPGYRSEDGPASGEACS